MVRCLSILLLVASFSPTSLGWMSTTRRSELKELTRQSFFHAYNSYKRVAFPSDELLPLSCKGQGHDRAHPDNVGVNDVMGDYVLTLVDTLDTFAILGDYENFENGVREVIQHVGFDKDSRVQVFEVTIRMLGGLLSAHLLASDPKRGFALPWYKGEMLALARDLGRRLLPAFNSPTGIPYSRVHLQHGVRVSETPETCAAAAGSLLLEFGTLSRLTGDPIYEEVARKAFFATWHGRSPLNLIGNTLNVLDGKWMHGISSTGAGIDSFFEYAAKSYVLFGEDEWWRVWEDAYAAIMKYIRAPDGFWYRGVGMHTGQIATVLVDSLSAFFPGVQTLVGDVESAIKGHAVYAFQWKRYQGLPEVFDINRRQAVSLGYPLRPEFIESNHYLYQATRDDYYLEMAELILHDLNNRTRTECGFAAVLDLKTGALEDKQPSFLTSETLKYLYLTFDVDNPFNQDDSNTVYSTEGHMLRVDSRPTLKRRRRSIPLAAASCPAYNPLKNSRTQHFLSQSVSRRTDFEHARLLTGFIVEDEVKEIEEGRWSESSRCEVPVLEEHSLELLFAPSGDLEDLAPRADKVRQDRDGTIFVGGITGLRFSLTRTATGGDGFVVSQVGPFRIPRGGKVVIGDPAVLAAMPVSRAERLQLEIVAELPDGKGETVTAGALAASFGPPLSRPSPIPGSFAVSLPPLPLLAAPLHYGCTSSSIEATLADGKVLVLRRGGCSFAKKSNVAALSGAKGVICVNSSDDNDLVPSSEGEDNNLKALVPLVLVSNSTGELLEQMLRDAGTLRRVTVVPKESSHVDVPEPLILGGYQVLNVRLQRI